MVSIRSIKIICFIILFSEYGLPVHGSVALTARDSEAITSRFQKKQKETKTLECNLKQILKIDDISTPIQSKGRIYYKAPDSLLIKFDEPADEFTLLLGNDLYLKKAKKSLVHRIVDPNRSSMEGMLGLLSVFQNGAEAFNKVFDVVMNREGKKIHIVLTPKKDGENSKPTLIETVLTAKDCEILSIHVAFDENNSITYELSSPQRNQKMDDNLFHNLVP